MISMPPIIQQYLSQASRVFLGVFLSLISILCGCGNDRQSIQEKIINSDNAKEELNLQDALDMTISLSDLVNDLTNIEVGFNLIENNKTVDLTQFKLKVSFSEIGGNGSKIAYKDRKNTPKEINNSLVESIAYFSPISSLNAGQRPLKILFNVIPGKDVTAIDLKFELLGPQGKIKEHVVNWKKMAVGPRHVKLGKLAYNSTNATITYTIQNAGAEEVKDVQLRYINISTNDIEKGAVLNNQQSGTINFPTIPAGKSTSERTLAVDFKTATQAIFKFEVICQGSTVENATRIEKLVDRVPKLKLVPITPTSLVGSNREIRFKIEKQDDSGNVDISKLELLITEVLNSDAKVYYKGVEVTKLANSALGTIGNEIAFVIQPGTDLVASFVFQLMYQGNKLGMPETFIWMEPSDPNQELFGAASRNDATRLKKLLQIPGIDINSVHRLLCQTPLHLAIQLNSQAAMETLLAADNINVNLKDKCGNAPLHKAVIVKNEAAIQALLAKGANINIKGEEENTPLHIAIKGDTSSIVKLLLAQGADFNIKNKKGKSPFDLAKKSTNLEIKELLGILTP